MDFYTTRLLRMNDVSHTANNLHQWNCMFAHLETTPPYQPLVQKEKQGI